MSLTLIEGFVCAALGCFLVFMGGSRFRRVIDAKRCALSKQSVKLDLGWTLPRRRRLIRRLALSKSMRRAVHVGCRFLGSCAGPRLRRTSEEAVGEIGGNASANCGKRTGACPSSDIPGAMSEKLSPPTLNGFAIRIRDTIAQRGYFVASSDALSPLWEGEALSPTEKLIRLHEFAAAQNWHVTGRDACNEALFQATEQGPVSAASWRLDGNIERALSGRAPGKRESAPIEKSGPSRPRKRW